MERGAHKPLVDTFKKGYKSLVSTSFSRQMSIAGRHRHDREKEEKKKAKKEKQERKKKEKKIKKEATKTKDSSDINLAMF